MKIKNIFVLVLTAGLLAIVGLACFPLSDLIAEETASSPTQTVHRSPDFHYEIAVPNASWKILPKPNGIIDVPNSSVELYSEDKVGYFVVLAEKSGMNLPTLRQVVLAQGKAQGISNYEILKDEPITINGVNGNVLFYMQDYQNLKWRYVHCLFVNKGFIYQLYAYTYSTQYSPDLEKDFLDIIHSFKFIA